MVTYVFLYNNWFGGTTIWSGNGMDPDRKKNTFPLDWNGEFGNNIRQKTLAGSFLNVIWLVSYLTPPIFSHTFCSCVFCNACRNTSASSSEEDNTTLSTDSSRTVWDTTSEASDVDDALELADLLTATDVAAFDLEEEVDEEQKDDNNLSWPLFSFSF